MMQERLLGQICFYFKINVLNEAKGLKIINGNNPNNNSDTNNNNIILNNIILNNKNNINVGNEAEEE